MPTVILWIQSSGFAPTGEEVRTILLTISTGLLGWSSRMLYCLRDDVRDAKKDIKQIQKDTRAHAGEIQWLTHRRIEEDAILHSQRQQWQGPERRRAHRREIDEIRDTFSATGEHPTTEDSDT